MYETNASSRDRAFRRTRWRDHLTHYLGGITLLVAMVLLTACASSQRRGSPFSGGGERNEIRIEVLNLNFNDATLWAIGDGTRRRLGVVLGKNDADFTIPWRLSGPLAIQIDILAGGRCITQEMMTNPGDIIELQIPAQLGLSELCR